MLLEFACSNHKSIRSEVLFSMLAGRDTTHKEKTFDAAGVRVLKAAVVYGANGSGKSNLIDAVSFVKNLVTDSVNHQPGQGVRQTPHKLDGFGRESSYRVQFVTKGIRYAYGFSLKDTAVSDEYLYYFPDKRQAKVFERSGDGFTAGSRFRERFAACKDVLRPNRLLLSCAANFSSVQEVANAHAFFSDELVVYMPAHQENWLNHSLHRMSDNPKMKAAVNAFLAKLGTGIKDIQVSVDQRKPRSAELPPFPSDESEAPLLHHDAGALTAKVVYEGFETDLFQEESAGVKKLLAILCPIVDALVNGKVLVCDGLESSLHESILHGLVRLFINADTEAFPQMILATHETGLLNLNLFRRDQIWFTELANGERSTDLYSLAEIKNVRREENFAKGYVAGKYGAIPMLDLDFTDIASHIRAGV